MANVRRRVPADWDFEKTGRMATTALVVAAVIVGIVALLTVAYLSR